MEVEVIGDQWWIMEGCPSGEVWGIDSPTLSRYDKVSLPCFTLVERYHPDGGYSGLWGRLVVDNVVCRVRNGEPTSFWHDNWVGPPPCTKHSHDSSRWKELLDILL